MASLSRIVLDGIADAWNARVQIHDYEYEIQTRKVADWCY